MNTIHKRKLIKWSGMLVAAGMSAGFVLYALRQNISLYYTPTQFIHASIKQHQMVRIGGIVVAHTVRYFPHSTEVQFAVTDSHHVMTVNYDGLLPDLFRVGRTVVVEGYLRKNGLFQANQVLAKHGANYHG